MRSVNYIPAERFETLANRDIRMSRGSSLVIHTEGHPESGAVYSVILKYDGDGYVLDNVPLMLPARSVRGRMVSGGAILWKDSAKIALKALYRKERDGAHEFCFMQDEAFLKSIGWIA